MHWISDPYLTWITPCSFCVTMADSSHDFKTSNTPLTSIPSCKESTTYMKNYSFCIHNQLKLIAIIKISNHVE